MRKVAVVRGMRLQPIRVALATLVALSSCPGWAQASDSNPLESPVFRQAAQAWLVTSHEVVEVPGKAVWVDPDSRIRIGTGFMKRLRHDVQSEAAALMQDFALLHELWHLRQRSVGRVDDGRDESRQAIECEADTMAIYTLTSFAMLHTPGMADDDLRRMDVSTEVVSELAHELASISDSKADNDRSLREYQRFVALQFGFAFARIDWLRDHWNSIPPAQSLALSTDLRGYGAVRGAASVVEGVSRLCRHVARDDGGVLHRPFALPMLGPSEELPTPEEADSDYVEVSNNGDHSVVYSVIGIGGLRSEDAPDDSSRMRLTDVSPIEVTLKPQEHARLRFRLPNARRWTPSYRPEDLELESFSFTADSFGQTLFAMRLEGTDGPVDTCMHHRKHALMRDPVRGALLRVGASASDGFSAIRGKESSSPALDGKVFDMNFPLPNIGLSILRSPNGSSVALLSYPDIQDVATAKSRFNDEVAAIRAACAPQLDAVLPREVAPGTFRFEVPRLTEGSSAALTLSEVAKPEEPAYYVVSWIVTPRIPDGNASAP